MVEPGSQLRLAQTLLYWVTGTNVTNDNTEGSKWMFIE